MSNQSSVSLTRVSYVILFVKNVPEAAAFYKDTLGIPARFESEHWTEMATEGLTLALHHVDESVPFHHPALPEVVFHAEDVRALHGALKGRGVKIHDLKPVHEAKGVVGLSAEFHDPDGNRLSIYGTVPANEWKAE